MTGRKTPTYLLVCLFLFVVLCLFVCLSVLGYVLFVCLPVFVFMIFFTPFFSFSSCSLLTVSGEGGWSQVAAGCTQSAAVLIYLAICQSLVFTSTHASIQLPYFSFCSLPLLSPHTAVSLLPGPLRCVAFVSILRSVYTTVHMYVWRPWSYCAIRAENKHANFDSGCILSRVSTRKNQ